MHVIPVGGHRIGCPAVRNLDSVVTEVWERREATGRGKVLWESIHNRHISKIEAARCTGCSIVIVQREVSIAIGIGTGGRNVGRVENVSID